ncbi:cysteine sulfinic acid decarboxylase-like [Pollicipes pollicipes]|uniref:cysteine sulfinic acid decarboxylase-like n=1 Tax=Pollicipes pollicipes TaxID=41117 RepID=UPI00188500E0|nr:cysteine sulfinic acid decarboxylase-like [Pollicipes pollicipes]
MNGDSCQIRHTKPANGLASGVNGARHQSPSSEAGNGCDVLSRAAFRSGDVKPAEDARRAAGDAATEQQLAQLLPLVLGAPTSDDEQLLELCRRAAQLSVRTGDFRFRNQLFGGTDEYGLAGALLTECLNTSQYTFEVAPVFTLCEAEVLRHVRRLISWPDGDGIFAAGGSMANQYGLALARYHRHPEVKTRGLFGRRPMVVFTSEDAHYSILKAAHWHGYGCDNVVRVPTDGCGRMRPDALEAAVAQVLAEDREPLVVNATCGTTVLGAYDPLPEIADICQRHGLWLHVDACWGGAALLSRRWRPLLAGLERADSVAWNPHKMLGAPLQCSLFVTRHAGLLHRCNAAAATYLFQQDKFYDVSFDTGDKSVQCGRKVDAFKLWLMWKAHGDAGLERMVDAAFAASRYCADQVALRPGFRPVLAEPQCANVCFWYVPPSLRGQEETAAWWQHLSQVAPRVKEAMVHKGSLMVGYQPLPHKQLVNFFRLVFTCVPEPGKAEVDYALDEIDRLADEL